MRTDGAGGSATVGLVGRALLIPSVIAVLLGISGPAAAQNEVRGWGTMVVDSSLHEERFVDILPGAQHNYAFREDGTVAGWGINVYGMCEPPPLPPGVTWVDMAPGWYASLGLRSDGLLVGWGRNRYGELDIPDLPPGISWVKVVMEDGHSAGLRSDGTIVAVTVA